MTTIGSGSSAGSSQGRAGLQLRDVLVVLGMHRSGTSALSGVLARLGAAPPRTLMQATEFNPRGYWESVPLMKLHDQVLRSAGSHWADWAPFNTAWYDSSAKTLFEQRLGELLAEEYGGQAMISVKDPRVSRFLPFWTDALEKNHITPKVLISLRRPSEVTRSLQHRNQFGPVTSQLLWLRHLLDAEHGSRRLARVFVRYEKLLADWKAELRRAADVLDVAWPSWSPQTEVSVSDFLSSELRHHRSSDADPKPSGELGRWVARAYEILGAFADGRPGDKAAFEELDRIRSEFNRTAEIFAPAVIEVEQRERKQREQLAARVRLEIPELTQRLDSERKQREEAEAQLENVRKDLEQERKGLEQVRKDLQQERKHLGQARTDLEHLRKDLSQVRKDLERERREREQARKELEGLASARKELERTRGALREANSSLAQAKRAQGQLMRELSAHRSEVAAARKQVEVLRLEARMAKEGLDQVLRSNTWKLGRPLRAARRLVAGMPARARTVSEADVERVRSSGMFDEEWYLARNPDVAALGLDPVRHYLAYGCREGRDPSPRFSTTGYYKAHPEISAVRENALLHFLEQRG